jgi:ATP-dependent helicase HrpB
LPIDPLLPDVVARLAEAGRLVLQAPPGAGKTTRVAPAVLDAGLAGRGQVLVLQPRRLAARAAAARIATERGGEVGGEIGYQVRFERRAGAATRLLVMTEGIFIRMLQDDPFLEHVGAVVFDEFHERSLHSDLALAMVRRVQSEARPDLKVVVMSATLDAEPVARYLYDCPVLTSFGRAFPVEISYLRHELSGPLEQAVTDAIAGLVDRTPGDVLVFLPGVGEIRRAEQRLSALSEARQLAMMPLYGDMPLAEQQAVLRPADRRKVVLATNVAETSLTIDGITAVVDSGLARQSQLEPGLGLNRLALVRISRAAADQRAGRAGRTAPGTCLRLWTERQQHGLAEHTTPEIRRTDLAGPALELRCWGERDLHGFPWFESPPAEALDQAIGLLQRLEAIDDRGPTELGRAMVRLPVHPRIGRLLIEGERLGDLDEAALAGALLSERDPFLRETSFHGPSSSHGGARGRRGAGGAIAANAGEGHWSDSDVLDRVTALVDFAASRRRDFPCGRLDPGAARQVLRASEQLQRLLREERQQPGGTRKVSTGKASGTRDGATQAGANSETRDTALLRALLAAFPDRVARRREPLSRRGIMVGGRGVRLDDRSALGDAELFVCVDLQETGKSEALVRLASAIERDWLPQAAMRVAVEVEFDPARERVIARRRVRWHDLLLEEAATSVPGDYDAAALLASEAASRLNPRDWLDEDAARLLARIQCLRVWMPELQLPDWTEDKLRDLLPRLCAGCLSLDELRRRPLVPVIKAELTGAQLAALEREAPERIRVPSGSQVALIYEPDKPPVMAVRIQEIFGLPATPRIAAGRVPVLLHLLAPNMRPQQITDDLASFWDRTYAEVRKELRRRYPKHSWPEDPRAASPERRPGGMTR